MNKYAYDAFGRVLSQTEGISNPFKFVGAFGVMDEDNGLLFMRARYYDPATGKFISKDPIGWAGGLNLYNYVGGNPVNRVDPWGLWYFDFNYTGTATGKFGPGGTTGFQIGPSGINFYYGFGLGFGKGRAVTFHPFGDMDTCSNVSMGVTFSGGILIHRIPVGAEGTITSDMNGNISPDFGIGIGQGFGVSVGPVHTIPLLAW